MNALDRFLALLGQTPAVLVSVESTQGSVPREAGAWMAVFAHEVVGTIGGGNLEFQALVHARECLAAAPQRADDVVRYPLGPGLGQCCGGVVALRFEPVTVALASALRARLAARFYPLALFGGGHVGAAVAQVVAMLPFSLTWLDSRDGIFTAEMPANVVCEHSDPVQAAVPQLPPGTRVVIMSFSHAEDLDIVAACLRRQRERADLPYVGLIGSKTKWATFRRRLRDRGFTEAELAHITCPIGIAGITGKQPEVIAVAVAAQLLQSVSATHEIG
ncbi:MAG TPA: xanthine dehydrogenase accessory protein XdhC [Burkholderiaceae bacterium]